MVKYIVFWHCCFDPFSVSFQKASHTPLQATDAQFTCAANTSCMPWKNDKLLINGEYFLITIINVYEKFTITNMHFLYLYLLNFSGDMMTKMESPLAPICFVFQVSEC